MLPLLAAVVCVFLPFHVSQPAMVEDDGFSGAYRMTEVVESSTDGTVLRRVATTGQLRFISSGRYELQLGTDRDAGSFTFSKGGGKDGRDVVSMKSDAGGQYLAYPDSFGMRIYLGVNEAKNHLWLIADQDAPAVPNAKSDGPQTTEDLIDSLLNSSARPQIAGMYFGKLELYGTSSAPVYYRYDPATGDYSFDGQGIIFTPAGKFYINSKFGVVSSHFTGTYVIQGSQVLFNFSDGSKTTMELVDNGAHIKWYSEGNVIANYTYISDKK